jgi:TolA-binding protein
MSWLARLARPSCPPGWKLTRAVSEAADPRTEWHVMRCERCSAEYRALQDLAQSAKAAAPVPEKLTREARDGIGTRLRALAAAAAADRARRERSTRRGLLWIALLVPAVVTVVWMVRRADHALIAGAGLEAPAPGLPMTIGDTRATIRAIGPARFSRAQFQPDEIVRLDDGEIELEIAPLHAHERFRVVTDDGEVEVRGTRFKVSVIDHHLAGVHVWKGLVEVRSSGGAQAMLAPGDDWVREASPASAPAAAEPAVAAPAREPDDKNRPRVKRRSLPAGRNHAKAIAALAPGPKSLPAARDPRAMSGLPSFGHAWSLLRSGDANAAAAEFAEVERLAHGRDIEEDALYWRAVAVGRAGDGAGARTLFAAFLDRFPSSSRAGEAAAALGGLLLDAGDRHGARLAFERAARDPSPRVRAAAQDGLRRAHDDEP